MSEQSGVAAFAAAPFRQMVEQAAEMIFFVGEEGEVAFANRRAESALGFGEGELVGRSFLELIGADDRAGVGELLALAGEREDPVVFSAGMIGADDSICPIDARAAPVLEDGVLRGTMVMARALAQARPGTMVKRRAMDHIAGYVRVDAEGRILGCNPAFLRIFGFDSEQQAQGTDFWSLCAPAEIRGRLAAALRALGSVENFEIKSTRRDGSTLFLLLNVIGKLDDEGDIESMEAQILDVSQKHKLERQFGRAQRMEALGRLACGVAHDFNNLLTGILGFADILEMSLPEDFECKFEVEEIRKAGERGASLTRQLLTFGRGKVVDVQLVNLNDVIHEMNHLLNQLTGGDIDLVLDLSRDLAPMEIDRSQIEQVILNLVINARDAMEDHGKLTLETLDHRVERPFVLHHDSVLPGNYTMLAVRDTGCGIDQSIMDHLFEPFFTTKEPGKGTGMGLSTVYGIVKQNRGFISVYNEPEAGVTFKVSFPSAARPA
ncbi:MAG: PAS domain S-box protein [bacterium]|nr:PAS domain S-box protein [bacterium]